MTQRRNVLFITADQWRGDCLSALEHPCVETPNLDALGREGVLFARHYANAVPCGPSRASLHTGLYLMNHRSCTNGTPLDRRHVNWAQVTRAAGYDPVLFGYTDTSVDPRDYRPDDPVLTTYEGILPGLDLKVHVNSEDVAAWARWLADQGYVIPARPTDLYRQKASQPEWEDGGEAPAPLAIRSTHHDTRFLTDRVIDYLTERAGATDPWCVHLSLLRPHPPFIAPEPYNARYHPDLLPPFRRAASRAAEADQHPYLAFEVESPGRRTPRRDATLRRLQASYYGLMSEVDDNLGRLFDALRDTGHWQDTLIVFTSDHGEQMGDHWLMGKCGYFDQSYHVPLIVRDPTPAGDGTRGRVVWDFTEHVDVMPTLLRWLDLDVPPACDGCSLLPFVTTLERAGGWRDAAHWEFDFRNVDNPSAEEALGLPMHACNLAVLRSHRFKFVYFAALPPLLFDLEADPDELEDLSRDPGYRSVMLDCAERMLSWRMRHVDQTLTHLKLTRAGVTSRPGRRW